MSNPFPKENPGAASTASGVKTTYEAAKLPDNTTPKRSRNAIWKWINPAQKSVCIALACALVLGRESAWHGLTIVLMARLSEQDRAALAYAVLNSLDEDDAYATASFALFDTLGGECAA
ncbi:hypothetical protein [Sedimentitalea todarodis]|uniref:Uncharacterized protein n=1 Tax=Sedimentitalea todarodis TaxID=1631240 RepID=A0ABU3VJ72_9RHOB|nr:hypothetical protein [Sedimentitalea todarodis]MDU9005759.1 hypothetical protein [Sedimentitalea todarodis]